MAGGGARRQVNTDEVLGTDPFLHQRFRGRHDSRLNGVIGSKGRPHRIKVVGPDGLWVWKRFSEIKGDAVVALPCDQLIGEHQSVTLPPFEAPTGPASTREMRPRTMTPELAELLGYFMGDGSLHSRGIRLCVDLKDFDVLERLAQLGKELFKLEATPGWQVISSCRSTRSRCCAGGQHVALPSINLVRSFGQRIPSSYPRRGPVLE